MGIDSGYKDGAHIQNNLCIFAFTDFPGRLAIPYVKVDTVPFKLLQIAFKLLICQCLVVKWQLLLSC